MTVDQFATKIKTKYPVYQNQDNQTLVNKILDKYPVYKSQVQTDQQIQQRQAIAQKSGMNVSSTGQVTQPPKQSWLDKIGSIGDTLKKNIVDPVVNTLQEQQKTFERFGQAAKGNIFQKAVAPTNVGIQTAGNVAGGVLGVGMGLLNTAAAGITKVSEFIAPDETQAIKNYVDMSNKLPNPMKENNQAVAKQASDFFQNLQGKYPNIAADISSLANIALTTIGSENIKPGEAIKPGVKPEMPETINLKEPPPAPPPGGTTIDLREPKAILPETPIKSPVDTFTNSQKKVIDGNLTQLNELQKTYAKLRKVQDAPARQQAVKLLSQTDLLTNSVDKDGTLITRGKGMALENLDKATDPYETVVSNILDKEGKP